MYSMKDKEGTAMGARRRRKGKEGKGKEGKSI
jgi:hypothetical protein